jgi:dihydroorotate dehydrogenase
MTVIPEWFLRQSPIYDIRKSYAENAADGPFFSGNIPARPPVSRTVSFLGRTLSSAIGIPAGPLLNARWVALASRLGFDLLTYKTIRSCFHAGHPWPNMVFVKPSADKTALAISNRIERLEELTVTNSFGMPSQSREFLLKDIDCALSSLHPGQAMIVSVVGSLQQGKRLADDFVDAALIAREAGAPFIEANFSCPNVSSGEGILYLDPEAVFEVSCAIVQAIAPIPLIIKVGIFPSIDLLQKVLRSASRAKVRAICGINSVSMRVLDQDGRSKLGDSRPISGICGAAIRLKALEWIQSSASIIRKEKLDLTLMGCGGLMRSDHFDECFDAGALIAMSATAMMWDPFLALRAHWRSENERKTRAPTGAAAI